MELILWRHAEAEDTHPDMDRALTAKGHKQAERMAAWLNQRLPENTVVLVSPAKRTLLTAIALDRKFTTLDELAPGASAQTLLKTAGWPNAEGAVLVVGHQPTLGQTAALAMTGKADYWSVKKGAIYWIGSRVRGEDEQSVLRAALSPDLL